MILQKDIITVHMQPDDDVWGFVSGYPWQCWGPV